MRCLLLIDLQTTTDKVQDAERRLNQARNFLRPKLNLYGEFGMTAEETSSLSDQELKDDFGAGITLEIPFDRRDERDAVKTASLDRSELLIILRLWAISLQPLLPVVLKWLC